MAWTTPEQSERLAGDRAAEMERLERERDAAVAQRDALREALERVVAEGATRDAAADLEHVQNIAREAFAGLEEA